MQQTCKLILAAFASIAGITPGLHTASAQDVTTPGGYQFFVTPYLWMPSVHATTLTPLEHEPEVNSNVSFIDLLSHLDGAPFMGSAEVRYGQLGFLVDAIHLPVSTTITTHDIFFQGGTAELSADEDTGRALARARRPATVRRCRPWLPCLGIFVEGGAQPWSASRCECQPQRRLDRWVGAHSDWQVMGMKSSSRREGLTAVMGFESGTLPDWMCRWKRPRSAWSTRRVASLKRFARPASRARYLQLCKGQVCCWSASV